MRIHATALLTLTLVACGSGSRDELMPTASAADDDELLDAGSSGETGGDFAPPEREGDTGMRLDLPAAEEMSCQKIDFLFVIDDSGSMKDEQERLIDGFPGFIEGVEEAIAQYDYHLMVISTAYDDADPTDCSDAVGAGLITDGEGTQCGLTEEGEEFPRFADGTDEGLADVFSCIGDLGVGGSGSELPMWAMAQALTTQSLPDGCNAGFLRDDALLVVTIISDEEDYGDSPGGPKVWKDVVVETKNGDEGAVVMLGLIGDPDVEDGACKPYDNGGGGAQASPRLRKFIESFEYGSWASVCLDDYAPFFNDAIEDIGQACTDFVPPG